ncbi:restriction endonuclease subunit S [Lactobacillus sp. RTP31084st1_F9_RTP31084_210423]|jgi:type I restriction enzyme S subunit
MKCKLGDLVQSISDTYDFKGKYSVIFVNTSDVYDGNISGVKSNINKLPGQAKKSIENDDILFSEIRPKNKRFALVEKIDTKKYVVSTKLMVLRNNNHKLLDTKYLYLYLTSPTMIDYFQNEAESRSGTFPQITFKDNVANVEIDLPSLKEQQHIVQKINTINEKIVLNNQINDNLSKIQLLNLSKLINNKLYEISKIKDLEITVSDHVANGSFKALKDNVTYFDYPNYALFIRNVDFKNNLSGNKRYINKESYNYLKKSHLFGGEVVISNVADVGSVHRVPFIKKPMVVGNNQIFIKSKYHTMTDYLYVYFQSFWGQSAISSITSGSAQQKFNKTDFRSLEVPIPTKNWIQSNITPYVTLQDRIFNENQSLKRIKVTLLNHYF